ncbi:alkaline phosphatase [Porticoccaceae bacterium]|jgi:alkaline phosphatase|nr:alkaline phosphatase [Porticoccaceae bacterium]
MKKLLIATLIILTGCGEANTNQSIMKGDLRPLVDQNNDWYQSASQQIQQQRLVANTIQNEEGAAKNIILFIGDGMSLTTVTASRILEGQQRGLLGEENNLSFDNFPFSGLSKTYAVDAQVADSANTMTAIMSGVKTNKGIVGINESVVRGECTSQAGNEVISALDLAELAGLSTGIVTTTRVTHATPAATYAKSADRDWEGDSDMPLQALNDGCMDIAAQLVEYKANLNSRYKGANTDGIEFVMGGGRRHFLPKSATINQNSTEGRRTDGRDLIAEWKAHYPDGLYMNSRSDFDSADFSKATNVFGLFNKTHMRFDANRQSKRVKEPSLSQMTEKALQVLSKNPKGFFLMVEAGRIDHAHHVGNAFNALSDTIELSKAVEVALKQTDPEDTLIIVTADHSHVFTMAGYPKRGNPIMGKVVSLGDTKPQLADDNLPYTTLGYTNGIGHRHLGSETDADKGYNEQGAPGRANLNQVDTTQSGFFQESLVPLESETHSGEDVPIYASGPGAHLISGSNEQTLIFHAMNHAAGLLSKAKKALED